MLNAFLMDTRGQKLDHKPFTLKICHVTLIKFLHFSVYIIINHFTDYSPASVSSWWSNNVVFVLSLASAFRKCSQNWQSKTLPLNTLKWISSQVKSNCKHSRSENETGWLLMFLFVCLLLNYHTAPIRKRNERITALEYAQWINQNLKMTKLICPLWLGLLMLFSDYHLLLHICIAVHIVQLNLAS